MRDLAPRLAARTLELVDIPSESRHEERIRRHLLDLVPPSLAPAYEGDEAYLFLPPHRPEAPLVLLAGHYDTVPAQQNVPGRIAEGAVHGLGASDMKGGVAVAIELVRDLAGAEQGALDVGLLLFGREEIGAEFDPLPALFERCAPVHGSALAILLEPTDGCVEAGCLGNLVAEVVFHGSSGHSARPWLADNAIAKAVEGLGALTRHPLREAEVEGLVFVESLSLTRLAAGIADNVIPDRAHATLSFRYAPDRTPAEAVRYLESLVPQEATLEVRSNSPAGAVVAGSPSVRALLRAGAREIRPKQAWTNVADFTAHGLDAVNFGPGNPAFAHRRDERVDVAALVHAYETLRAFVATPIEEDAL